MLVKKYIICKFDYISTNSNWYESKIFSPITCKMFDTPDDAMNWAKSEKHDVDDLIVMEIYMNSREVIN